ncbi:Cys-tRNA(Pro) deacylase [Bacillus smithii]|uniref:Cys-tRNA(Pro) deacylase n=1 Tax=Bacillus smithii TaxID=1479 RepID=UPI0022E10135|nr:Cys-tRNA(Pro) deacylase [Bacillus smithii]
MSKVKTNAIRMLDTKKIPYKVYTYEPHGGKIDGVSVAENLGKDPHCVFKTLVVQSGTKQLYVFVIPVASELDLKKAAKVAGEKKVEMLPVNELQKWTGYVRGGCSPIGMKKHYPVFIDKQALNCHEIIVSGGKIGVQIELSPADLQKVVNAKIEDLVKGA